MYFYLLGFTCHVVCTLCMYMYIHEGQDEVVAHLRKQLIKSLIQSKRIFGGSLRVRPRRSRK